MPHATRITELEYQLACERQKARILEEERAVLWLMHSSPRNFEFVRNALSAVCTIPAAENYVVLQLSLLPGIAADASEEISILHHSTRQLLEALCPEGTPLLHTRDTDSYFCIIGCSDPDLENSMPEKLSAELLNRLEATFSPPVCINISRSVHSLSDIGSAYKTLQQTAEYRSFVLDETPVLQFERIAYRITDANPRNAPEKRMVYALRTHHFSEAKEHLEAFFQGLLADNTPSVEMIYSQFYRLVNPLTDTAKEMLMDVPLSSPEWDMLNSALNRLHDVNNLNELKICAKETIDILEQVYHRKLSVAAPRWMNELDEYIRTQYRNPQISVSMLADRLGITSVHMSRVYRQLQGRGVMDYVHLLRVTDAKVLLKQGKTVKHVAAAMGYSSALSMTRAFKKHDGQTPGYYIPAHGSGTCSEASA